MARGVLFVAAAIAAIGCSIPLAAIGAGRDFSGRWVHAAKGGAGLRIETAASGEAETVLARHGEGQTPVESPAGSLDSTGFAARAETPPPGEFTVRSGTRIPLSLISSLDTKHSKEGDRVNLETRLPVSLDGRIVIPRGSFVTGTVIRITTPGRGHGKGELTIRFETLTLPNGITRAIQSGVAGADGAVGAVDRESGKITGERNAGDDARTADGRANAGAAAGSLAGAVTGAGSQVGWVAGAAAGAASVLVSRGPDVALRPGTILEMTLDRDLRYKPEELKF